MTEQDFRS